MGDDGATYHATSMGRFSEEMTQDGKTREKKRSENFTSNDFKETIKMLKEFLIVIDDNWSLPAHVKTKGDLCRYRTKLIKESLCKDE